MKDAPSANLSTTNRQADFNADGKSDILWQLLPTGELWVWFLNGTTYAGASGISGQTPWVVRAAVDFNGDSKPDILWQHPTTGELWVWFMNGVYWAGQAQISPPTAWKVVATGDFNADGQPDILWQNPSTGELWVWYMNGASWAGQAQISPATAWRVVGAADFNGDWKPDILWQHPTTGELWVWYMNGVTWTGQTQISPPTPWKVVGTGDFNADGKADIVWQSPSTGEVWTWLMNGSAFMSGVQINGGTQWTALSTSNIYILKTLNISAPANGTLTFSPNLPADHKYPQGTMVALTATPNAGYVFSDFSGSRANPMLIMMDADKSIQANFVLPPGPDPTPPPITRPTALEANLGPLPIDRYLDPNCPVGLNCDDDITRKRVISCASNLTVRQCYQAALAGYAGQGVTGVRFQFGLCGGTFSTALSNCDNLNSVAYNSTWDSNIRTFFGDIALSGIHKITPTPALSGFGGDVGALYRTTNLSDPYYYLSMQGGNPDPCRFSNQTTKTPVEYWPASPFLIVPDVPDDFPGKDSAISSGPHLRSYNNSYNCSPQNPIFVGWPKIYDVIDHLLLAAQNNNLTVEELDMSNETALDYFTVEARLIYDNKADEDVYSHLQGQMTSHGFDASRVTYSVVGQESTVPAWDCTSVYGDSARVFRASVLLSGISGRSIGHPASNDSLNDGKANVPYTNGLMCSQVDTHVTTPLTHDQLPSIIDMHLGPLLADSGTDQVGFYGQSVSTVQTEATTTFNAINALIQSYCDTGWRTPLGFGSSNLCNSLFMIGETPAYKLTNVVKKYDQQNSGLLFGTLALTNCDGSPGNVPEGTVRGFNSSTLSGRTLAGGGAGVVFRPWLDPYDPAGDFGPAVACYNFPQNIRRNFNTTP